MTKAYTKTELKNANHPQKRGMIGPLYWKYYEGYGNDIKRYGWLNLLDSAAVDRLMRRGEKAVGPVYLERPIA